MQIELKVVMIASIATLIVALINVFVSQRISVKQNLIELKKTRIELLESRRQSIEKVWSDMKNNILDIEGVDINNAEIMVPRIVKRFQTNSSEFLSIGHLFSKDFCDDIDNLRKEIDENIIKSRNNISISLDEVKSSVNSMSEMEKQMNLELMNRLREIETQIQELLNQ